MRWVPPVFHDDTTNTPAKSGTDDSYPGTASTDTSGKGDSNPETTSADTSGRDDGTTSTDTSGRGDSNSGTTSADTSGRDDGTTSTDTNSDGTIRGGIRLLETFTPGYCEDIVEDEEDDEDDEDNHPCPESYPFRHPDGSCVASCQQYRMVSDGFNCTCENTQKSFSIRTRRCEFKFYEFPNKCFTGKYG